VAPVKCLGTHPCFECMQDALCLAAGYGITTIRSRSMGLSAALCRQPVLHCGCAASIPWLWAAGYVTCVWRELRTATPLLLVVRACMLVNACLPLTPACKAIRRWLMVLTLALLSGSGAAVSRFAPQLPTSYLFLLPPPVCRFAGTQLSLTAHWFARLCLKDCYSVCVVTAT
jgi:hypothetical protein